jgi:hypothetical protein
MNQQDKWVLLKALCAMAVLFWSNFTLQWPVFTNQLTGDLLTELWVWQKITKVAAL